MQHQCLHLATLVVFGRDIWQHADPPIMLAALRNIIHNNATVPQALASLS
jgi:DhnA family fructose-bisphosphate aldolase class Ia